jgi:hypothetical protein
MHLDGNESHGEAANLAYGCRSCNGKLAAAFKAIGAGRPTNQYNPASGGVPTFQQYAWAVSNHTRTEHDEGGAVIHATPKHKRIEYARRIAAGKARSNPWPFSRPDARRTTPASGGIAYHTSKRRPATVKKAAAATAGKKGGTFSVPDEKTLEAGFKRGLSLREILGNPAATLRYRVTPEMGGYLTTVQEKRAGEWVVVTWRRFGTKAQAVASGKDYVRRVKRNPSDESVQDKSWREWAENYERVQRDPNAASAKDLRRALGYLDKARSSMIRRAHEKGAAPDANVLAGFDNDYEYLKSLMLNKERGKRNPAAASAEAFTEFHGFEPSEVITVTKQVHYHKHLAAAGKLVSLDVWGIDGQGHRIAGFKGAFLAFNEQKNQLFVEGGDQAVNLEDFGITSPHELETLGRLTDIGYHTNKTHLGDEGGEAVYVHKFRTTNDNGKHVVVKIARYPDLIYDVRNEQLLFSGGSYEILREGIDK